MRNQVYDVSSETHIYGIARAFVGGCQAINIKEMKKTHELLLPELCTQYSIARSVTFNQNYLHKFPRSSPTWGSKHFLNWAPPDKNGTSKKRHHVGNQRRRISLHVFLRLCDLKIFSTKHQGKRNSRS